VLVAAPEPVVAPAVATPAVVAAPEVVAAPVVVTPPVVVASPEPVVAPAVATPAVVAAPEVVAAPVVVTPPVVVAAPEPVMAPAVATPAVVAAPEVVAAPVVVTPPVVVAAPEPVVAPAVATPAVVAAPEVVAAPVVVTPPVVVVAPEPVVAPAIASPAVVAAPEVVAAPVVVTPPAIIPAPEMMAAPAPPDVRKQAAASAMAQAQAADAGPIQILAQFVRQALQHNPQIFQFEAESRAANSRIGEAREGFGPRLTLSSSVAKERQIIDSLQRDAMYSTAFGQVRLSMPLIDKTLSAQLAQRRSSSITSDWRLTDVREQLMLRTIEAYVDLVRSANLLKLAQDNLKVHRQYVAQIKEIAKADLGRASDLPTAAGRAALAESVLTSRLAKMDASRVIWRQVTGLTPGVEFFDVPMVNLPETLDQVLSRAQEFNPVLMLATSEIETARRGIDLAKAPFSPRLSLDTSAKSGQDFGGIQGTQGSSFVGLTGEWTVFSGRSEKFAVQAAQESVFAAQSALDRVRDELRSRVEQTWYDLQASDASVRSFEDYAKNAQQMVEASQNQFKIGRRSLLDVLNAENELFTARSNLESTLQDNKLAAWRLHSLQGRVQSELGL
jgi:TolC family type I secretion outer membrane protein